MYIWNVSVVVLAGTVLASKNSKTLHSPPYCDHCAVPSGYTLQLTSNTASRENRLAHTSPAARQNTACHIVNVMPCVHMECVCISLHPSEYRLAKNPEALHSPPNCDHCAVQSGDTLQLPILLQPQ